MQVMPLAQLYALPDKTPIPAVAGMLQNIQKRFTGNGNYGQYSFQNAELFDGQTRVHLIFKDRQDCPLNLQGQRVYIQGNNGNGVQAKDHLNKQSKQMERVLWVTAAAVVEPQDGAAPGPVNQTGYPAPVQPQAPPAYAPAPTYAPAPAPTQAYAPAAVNPAPQPQGQESAKVTVARAAQLHQWCLSAVVVELEQIDLAGADLDVTAIAATLFIETCKRVDLAQVPILGHNAKTPVAAPQPPQPSPLPPPSATAPEADRIPF